MNENLPAAYGIAKEVASMQQYIVGDYKVFLNDLAYFATNTRNVDDINVIVNTGMSVIMHF